MKDRVTQLLEDACSEFELSQSYWGRGVSNYLMGLVLSKWGQPSAADETEKIISHYREALACFQKISHLRGCVVTEERLIAILT